MCVGTEMTHLKTVIWTISRVYIYFFIDQHCNTQSELTDICSETVRIYWTSCRHEVSLLFIYYVSRYWMLQKMLQWMKYSSNHSKILSDLPGIKTSLKPWFCYYWYYFCAAFSLPIIQFIYFFYSLWLHDYISAKTKISGSVKLHTGFRWYA